MLNVTSTMLIRTLIVNGYHLKSVDRLTREMIIIRSYKFGNFGDKVKYCLLYAQSNPSLTILSNLDKRAKIDKVEPIILCDTLVANYNCFRLDDFIEKLGGPVNTGLILNPQLPEILNTLGFNETPEKFEGEANDLLEEYVKECLRYMFNSPGRRYGQDRRFEKLPDGVIMGDTSPTVQFDSKAYSRGFNVESDDIQRFASYVQDFNQKYGKLIENVYSFVLVSGKFNQQPSTLQNKSNALYTKCSTLLTFITARDLGEITQIVLEYPLARSSIDWTSIFSNVIVTPALVRKQISAIKKDKIT